ncbi:hypothetical protein IJJ37_02945 [Candidatus Saccharibacteria bacterium]|nr:hypothetical protein [Candidatus Saccharibacteria bacterium]
MADNSATFTTTVDEMLTVSLEAPTASGVVESDGMVRNKVGLIVSTNTSGGYVASMTTTESTGKLSHNSNHDYDLSTLSANTQRSNVLAGYWGFSVDDTAEGNSSSTYKAIATSSSSTPSYIASTASGGSTTDIYFGAKAAASGTYTNSVVISVVSGVHTEPTPTPVTPDNPATPTDDTIADDGSGTYVSAPTGHSTAGTTVQTNTSSTGTTNKTVTQLSKGDTTDSYSDPQGVTTVAAINEGTPLATGLAVTAGVAAATGIAFFIVAKRSKDDEDDDGLDY